MIQCKCIQKYRDAKGNIYGYRLIDLNQQIQDVTPDDLKTAIRNNQVNVINLTLTSNNRLIDKKEDKQLVNKTIMPNKVDIKQNKLDSRNLVYNVANEVYKMLGYDNVEELSGFDNSYGNMIDKRFNPEINYCGQDLVLVVTYLIDKDEIWLALENMIEDEVFLELRCTANKEQIKTLINKFVTNIKMDNKLS